MRDGQRVSRRARRRVRPLLPTSASACVPVEGFTHARGCASKGPSTRTSVSTAFDASSHVPLLSRTRLYVQGHVHTRMDASTRPRVCGCKALIMRARTQDKTPRCLLDWLPLSFGASIDLRIAARTHLVEQALEAACLALTAPARAASCTRAREDVMTRQRRASMSHSIEATRGRAHPCSASAGSTESS